MSESVAVIWDDSMGRYDFGRGHPFAPVRVQLAMELVRSFGLLDAPGVEVVAPHSADLEALLAVHDSAYVDAVRRCSGGDCGDDHAFGLGTDDNPVFRDMHDATAMIVGGTLEAARRVWTGQQQHAVNLSGGLHHAMPAHASGFCVYNDLAVAIQWMLDNGAERVAYVDVDVHHGDGVEKAFWDDPRVLTISLHESGATQFPGTGWPGDVGGRAAAGTKVNCALPAGTGDDAWLRAFDAIVPPLLREFAPEVIVSQHGCDTHHDDPLGHMTLTIDGQRATAEAMHRLAHEYAGGRWITTGGGGYAVVEVVPRAWTHLVAEMVDQPLEPDAVISQEWCDRATELTHITAPTTMGDGRSPQPKPWAGGFNPDDPVDAAVMATRQAVFSHHGLDPWTEP